MIETRQLLVFQAVAREGSVSAAASALGYAQPTVSHHLQALERRLGTRLLDRGRRGAVLNDRGRVLLGHADAVLERLAAAERAVRDRAALEAGTVRVGTFPTAGATFLPGIVAELRARHPRVHVLVSEAEPPETVAAMRGGRLDIALTFAQPGDRFEPTAELATHHLFDDPLLLVLSPRHPLARRDRLALADLRDEAWLTGTGLGDPCTRLLLRACHRAGFAPRVALQSDDYSAISAFAAAGLGVALVPELALVRPAEGVVVRTLDGPPLVRAVHALMPAAGATEAAERMLELLHRHAAGR